MTGTSILGGSRRPDIIFRRNGTIDITSPVVRELGIQPGDVIDILARGTEHYLYVKLKASSAVGQHIARCRKSGKRTMHMRVSCRKITDYILGITGSEEAHLTTGPAVEIDGENAVPIITRNNLYGR